MVDAEHDDGGASDGSLPKERGASPSEMLEPLVTPWMKEPYDLTGSRIDARDIRPLVGITTKTGDRAILKCCLSPMLACNDVIDGKSETVCGLRHVTVFAAVMRTPANPVFELFIHASQEPNPAFFSDKRAFDCNRASKSATRRYSSSSSRSSGLRVPSLAFPESFATRVWSFLGKSRRSRYCAVSGSRSSCSGSIRRFRIAAPVFVVMALCRQRAKIADKA